MKMNIKSFVTDHRERIPTIILILSFGSFVIGYHALSNIFIIATCCFVVFFYPKKQLLGGLKKWSVLAFSIYFLLSCIGVLYSNDVSGGFKYVERRLLIILLPLLFSSLSLSAHSLRVLIKSMIVLTSVGVLIGFIFSFFNYLSTGDTGFFYNDNLVVYLSKQASYYSLFINGAIILCLFLKDKLGYYFLPLLVLAQFFLAVRLSIVFMLIILVLWIFYLGFRRNYRVAALGLVFILLTIIVIPFLMPQTANRFLSITKNFEYEFDNANPANHFNGEIKAENWNGLTLRLALWQCGYEIIKEHPLLGVGTGDYRHALRKKFDEKDFIYAKQQDFGVHNQYIYTFMTFGAIGLLLFMASYCYLIAQSWRVNNYLFVAFTLMLLVGFLTENILNRYYGVYYISFMSNLLFYRSDDEL